MSFADASIVEVRLDLHGEMFEQLFSGFADAVTWAVDLLGERIPSVDPIPDDCRGFDEIRDCIWEVADDPRSHRACSLAEGLKRCTTVADYYHLFRRQDEYALRKAAERRSGTWSLRIGDPVRGTQVRCVFEWA